MRLWCLIAGLDMVQKSKMPDKPYQEVKALTRHHQASAQLIGTTPPIWEGTTDAITHCLSDQI